jgi:hypothetical protein
MFRSLAFPGWGQLENGQPYKAGLVFAAETGLIAAGYVEWQRAERSLDQERAAADAGDQEAAADHHTRYLDRRDRAISRFWWSGFALLLSMLDAYTEAHLRDFVSAEVPELEIPTPEPKTAKPGGAGEPPAAPPGAAPADSAAGRPVSMREVGPTLRLDPWGMRLGVALSF